MTNVQRPMATLSVVLIVKNEAANMEPCIRTVDWADEIVVLDSGSSDDTLDRARRFTDRIFVDSDWQGYGIQRQRAQEKASGDWILMLDADERVTPQLRREIETALWQDDRGRVYALPRLSWCFGRFIRHSGWYPDYVVRLYPRERAGYGTERVHERLHYDSGMEIIRLTGDLLHYTYRDLQHYLVKSAGYAAAWAEQRECRGRTGGILQGLWHGVGCFLKMYLFRAGFLDGWQGLLLALLSAHSTFAKYADLWVRHQPLPPQEGG